MDEIDYKLVKKGASLPLAGVVEQGRYHAALADKYETQLSKRGWTRGNTNMLLTAVAHIDSERSYALDARDESKRNLYREQESVSMAKGFKADVVMAFDDLFFDGVIDAEDHKRVRTTNGTLGRSPTLISKYLNDIRSVVLKHEDKLRPYFENENAAVLLDAIKDQLDAAQITQETDYKALPRETLRVYEAKGKVLFLIEKMNRIAKRAFAGQAEIIGLFNKDLIQRARKTRRAVSTVEPVQADCGQKEETGEKTG